LKIQVLCNVYDASLGKWLPNFRNIIMSIYLWSIGVDPEILGIKLHKK
jgi:hypothetical protein